MNNVKNIMYIISIAKYLNNYIQYNYINNTNNKYIIK